MILALAARNGTASPQDLIDDGRFDLEVEIMGAASWLESKGLATLKEESEKFFILGTEGDAPELPERTAVKAISSAGGSMDMNGLADAMPGGADKIAVGWLKRKGLADIVKEGDAKLLVLTDKGRGILDSEMPDEALLHRMSKAPVPESEADKSLIKDLKGRQGMIAEKVVTSRSVTLTDLGVQASESGLD